MRPWPPPRQLRPACRTQLRPLSRHSAQPQPPRQPRRPPCSAWCRGRMHVRRRCSDPWRRHRKPWRRRPPPHKTPLRTSPSACTPPNAAPMQLSVVPRTRRRRQPPVPRPWTPPHTPRLEWKPPRRLLATAVAVQSERMPRQRRRCERGTRRSSAATSCSQRSRCCRLGVRLWLTKQRGRRHWRRVRSSSWKHK